MEREEHAQYIFQLLAEFDTIHRSVLSANHTPLFQNGIFDTREGKTYRQGRKPVDLEQMIRSGGIQKNLKSKTHSANFNLRLRCESSGKTKNMPTLAPRVDARNETRKPPLGIKRSLGGRNSATLNLVSKQTLEHP
ncbi:hypothetical protein AVEN_156683-1 [Araneus ventricosus]|uniref:Uncharacterized protein n=1 Tax=Araneus ventricosus TaxID=182803 RepID=A0A4Y2A661_ARAVE|nr:hypothetical protein AVEN_156683-1 [Araneus ventricosus]